MEKLEKKLLEIQELIKMLGMPSSNQPATPKPPTIAPTNKKNPVKVAQQIQNPPIKKLAVKAAKEFLKVEDNGQWKLDSK